MYSDLSGDYTRAYVSAEDADMPAYNVFTRRDGVIRYFLERRDHRNMADPAKTRGSCRDGPVVASPGHFPGGRGTDWHPDLIYRRGSAYVEQQPLRDELIASGEDRTLGHMDYRHLDEPVCS